MNLQSERRSGRRLRANHSLTTVIADGAKGQFTMASVRKICNDFAAPRSGDAAAIDVDGERIVMLTGWRAVRHAAKDWRTFSSHAPFRVPIPSEETVRSVRQLPIEADPPLHTQVRAQLEPWFRRPTQPDYQTRLSALIRAEIDRVRGAGETDLVRGFALPLQSRALALLLGLPKEDADEWIGWGTHVFHDAADAADQGREVHRHIEAQIQRARAAPGEDLFSGLLAMRIDDRPLSDDEMAGIANLVFAGGRDTIIHAIATLLVAFAECRSEIVSLAGDDRGVNVAVEELLRFSSPLAHIGRVCPHGAAVDGLTVEPGARVSLCWAGANADPSVFAKPERLILDRAPNPHVAFGSGAHTCLGAPQARAILRGLLKHLVMHTQAISLSRVAPGAEALGAFTRPLGYTELIGRFA